MRRQLFLQVRTCRLQIAARIQRQSFAPRRRRRSRSPGADGQPCARPIRSRFGPGAR